MNILHLRYAIEVAKTRSISKAAEALFMAQPNLSRAIKELEESIGITIFKRTSKGMSPTQSGEKFLEYAKSIIEQIDKIESLYKQNSSDKLMFSISVPRDSCITLSFVEFVNQYASAESLQFNFKETNSLKAIQNVLENNFNLGIIRFQNVHEQYFMTLLKEKGLASTSLWEFEYSIIMSAEHPLANQPFVEYSSLSNYIELAHGDPYVPYLPQHEIFKEEMNEQIKKRIFVYERGSQYDLLSGVPLTYQKVTATPQSILEKYKLVVKECVGNKRIYKDMLIYKKNYKLTELDKSFLKKLKEAYRECEV